MKIETTIQHKKLKVTIIFSSVGSPIVTHEVLSCHYIGRLCSIDRAKQGKLKKFPLMCEGEPIVLWHGQP